MNPASFVFLDKTGATTSMVRSYGWGPKGERLVDAALEDDHLPRRTARHRRRRPARPRRPMTGEAFRANTAFLMPALSPGDLVVMDHRAAH